MSEKIYKKRFEFQKKMISKQSEQIENLKSQIEKLELKCKEKDEIISSVDSLRNELINNIDEVKKHKKNYEELIKELRNMKNIINQTVYKNRWKWIKFLIK